MKPIILVILVLGIVSCTSEVVQLEHKSPTIKSSHILKDDIKSTTFKKLNSFVTSLMPNRNSIVLLDSNLIDHQTFGKHGRGPGEFEEIDNIQSTRESYFVHDMKNKTFSKFDLNGNFLSSVVYSDLVISFEVDELENIYLGVMGYDRLVVKMSPFEEFNKHKVIFSIPVRDLSESPHELNLFDNKLLINRVFTNETIMVDLNSLNTQTFVNQHLENSAEFKSDGEFKLPIRPVWRSNILMEDLLFQLRNIPDSKSEIYRSDLDGNIDALFTFNHYTTSFFEYGDEIWMFSPDSLYKYSKSSFLN